MPFRFEAAILSRDEGDAGAVEDIDDFGKVAQGAGQPVDLVDDDGVDPAGLDLGEKPLQRRPLHRPAGDAAIVIELRQDRPALVLLAEDEGLARLPLCIERVEGLLEPLLGGFAGVDRAAGARSVRGRSHLHPPTHRGYQRRWELRSPSTAGRRNGARTSACR